MVGCDVPDTVGGGVDADGCDVGDTVGGAIVAGAGAEGKPKHKQQQK